MKKIISIFIVLLIIMSLTTVAYAIDYPTDVNDLEITEPRITVSEKQAVIGENVNLRIALENNPGIVSMSLKACYDETALTLIDVQDSGRLGAQFHKPQYSSPYNLVWANDTATKDFTLNGVIVNLRFRVNESAVVGHKYPVTISYDADNYDIYNKDVETVDFDIVNGSISVITETVSTPVSDFSYSLINGNICITGYSGADTELFIGESYEIDGVRRPVTSIGECAFEGIENLVAVTLPASITEIGDYAFYDCTSLTNVTLWCKNAVIGEKAFGYYYVSKKIDGKVDEFSLKTYEGGSVHDYLLENEMDFVKQMQPVGRGDIDGDGEYGSSDLITIVNHLLEKSEIKENTYDFADMNDDGNINIIDLVFLKKKLVDL